MYKMATKTSRFNPVGSSLTQSSFDFFANDRLFQSNETTFPLFSVKINQAPSLVTVHGSGLQNNLSPSWSLKGGTSA
jgi:hypothetical protein